MDLVPLACEDGVIGILQGIENSIRPFVFTSVSGCRASGILIFLVKNYYLIYMPIFL